MSKHPSFFCFSRTACMLAACLLAGGTLADIKRKESGEDIHARGMAVFQVDPEASLVLFAKAARLGHVESMIRLGHCHQTGAGSSPNKKNALMWYKKSVEAGSSAALYPIGNIYETGGKGVPRDVAAAIEWYEKSVGQNSLQACAGLARIHASGDDPSFHDGPRAIKYATVLVQKNPRDPAGFDLLAAAFARDLQFDKALKASSQAIALSPLDEAAERRDRREAYAAGKPNPEIASDEWILAAAERENMWAMLKLAKRNNDLLSDSYDPSSARFWYGKAAEDGSSLALVKLGNMCLRGRGGPVDTKKAFWCFSEAAKAESPKAYAPLGRMYAGGKGTKVNLELALEWYRKSFDSGIKQGGQELGALRLLGKTAASLSPEELYGDAKRMAESNEPGPHGEVPTFGRKTSLVFPRYWLAAEQGNTDAMKELAEMYFYGKRYFVRDSEPDKKNGGINTDYAKALDWYEQLGRKGIELPEKALCEERFLEELKLQRERQLKKERDAKIAAARNKTKNN
jgi:TPR repeat protein